MKKLLPIAPLLFLGLASAAPPSAPGAMAGDGIGYPPCSRTVRDRCIQLDERGVRDHENLAVNRGQKGSELDDPGPPMARVQVSGGDYPPCTAARQDRCTQRIRSSGAAPTRYAMTERQRIRIGERG